jgi:hypothetical protein
MVPRRWSVGCYVPTLERGNDETMNLFAQGMVDALRIHPTRMCKAEGLSCFLGFGFRPTST